MHNKGWGDRWTGTMILSNQLYRREFSVHYSSMIYTKGLFFSKRHKNETYICKRYILKAIFFWFSLNAAYFRLPCLLGF